MKEEPTNKCKEQGFVHAWQDITENIVYATYPPQYPPRKEQCQNCGLTRTHCQTVEKWFEYEFEPKQSINGTVTIIIEDGVTGTTTIDSGTTKLTP